MCKAGGPRCPGAAKRQLRAAFASGKQWRIDKAREALRGTTAITKHDDPAERVLAQHTIESELAPAGTLPATSKMLANSAEHADLLTQRDTARVSYEEARVRAYDSGLEGDELIAAKRDLREAYFDKLDANAQLEDYQRVTMERLAEEHPDTGEVPDGFDRNHLGQTLGDLVYVGEYESGTQEWLTARQGSGDEVRIGGSDVAKIIGVNDNPAWNRKAHADVLASKVEEYTGDQDETFAQQKGNVWEPVIAGKFRDAHPEYDVIHSKATWANKDNPEFTANFDGLIASTPGGQPDGALEIKTSSHREEWVNANGEFDAPPAYRAQALWYLEQADLDYAYIAAVFDDTTYGEVRINRGEPITEELGTIQDNLDTIKKFQDTVRDHRAGKTPKKRTMNKHPKMKPGGSMPMDEQIALFQGRDTDEVAREIEERVAAGKDYNTAASEVMHSAPVNLDGMVVLDLETTAIGTHKGEIIELGWQRLGPNGEVVEEGQELFSPDPRFLRTQGTGPQEVHNISPEDVADKPRFTDPEVQKRLSETFDGATLVVHNARFEQSFLSQDLPGAKVRYADTMLMNKHFMPETPNNKLESFATANGVEYVGAHRALADVDMTRRALVNFAGRFATQD